MRRQRTHPATIASRKRRGDATCMVVLAIVMLTAVARIFTGTAILRHDHHELGSHTHAVPAAMVEHAISACHAEDHAASDVVNYAHDGGAMCDSGDQCAGGCDITVISLVTDPHPLARRVVLPVDDLAASWMAIAAWHLFAPPEAGSDPGAPGGRNAHMPRHLCALTAGQRLVATSRALLI